MKSRGNGGESLSGWVYQQIKELILRNEIMPGQKLYHQELSDRLGVSRTPVREALNRLAQEAYVTLLPNRGFTCREIGIREAEELYELREALEAYTVERAIKNLDEKALLRLTQKMELYGNDTRKRFSRERLLRDENIHMEIAELSGNETVKKALRQAFERIILKRNTDGLYNEERGARADQQHRALLQAMASKKTTEALKIIRSHIQEGKSNVLADLHRKKEIRSFRGFEAEE